MKLCNIEPGICQEEIRKYILETCKCTKILTMEHIATVNYVLVMYQYFKNVFTQFITPYRHPEYVCTVFIICQREFYIKMPSLIVFFLHLIV